MTGYAAAPLQVRRFSGYVSIALVLAIAAAVAVGAFVLGRVTGGDSGSTIAPVHTVYLPAAVHDASQQCRLQLPC